MKYCLSSRVDMNLLSKADEIKFQFRDRKAIPDFFEKYPNADIILYCGSNDMIKWDELKELNILSKGKIIFAFAYIPDLVLALDAGYRAFYGFPVTSFYELNALKNLGVEYVNIGIPLFFEMDKVKACGVPVRIVPNVAYTDRMPRVNGICGQWVRPEDLEPLYGEYVAAIEFDSVDPEKEAVLYRVYAVDKKWNHGLDLLIVNLDYEVSNRMIMTSQIDKRLNCGHRCQYGSGCRICERSFNLADPSKIEEYLKEVYPNGLPN